MQVGTGKSILNGIAIGKLKLYKKKNTTIAAVSATSAALYEKALAEAGEDIAEVFNIRCV